jgi:hypothetical protein
MDFPPRFPEVLFAAACFGGLGLGLNWQASLQVGSYLDAGIAVVQSFDPQVAELHLCFATLVGLHTCPEQTVA